MVSKIEAAERLAEAVERLMQHDDDSAWSDVEMACRAYRSANVPSDEELWRVAYEGAYASCAKWDDVPKEYGMLWTDAAAAVRQWVQRDGLTEEERAVIVDAMQAYLVGDPKCEPARCILRKLGHEPEPVWEWDEANAMWTLGGKVDGDVFPCASVSLSEDGGILGRVYYSDVRREHCVVDSYKEACEWCEQQLREARE